MPVSETPKYETEFGTITHYGCDFGVQKDEVKIIALTVDKDGSTKWTVLK